MTSRISHPAAAAVERTLPSSAMSILLTTGPYSTPCQSTRSVACDERSGRGLQGIRPSMSVRYVFGVHPWDPGQHLQTGVGLPPGPFCHESDHRPVMSLVKSKMVNRAVQDIGMGRYNWQLFILCGLGWLMDSLWLQGVSLTLPSLSAEFGVSEKTVRYTTTSLFGGLCVGAFFWGLASDILGRRLAFNTTVLITGVCGLVVAAAPSWPSVCVALAALGVGVGGNLPVDGMLFLEFLPEANRSLLTLLSVWWPTGNLVSAMAAWALIAHLPPSVGWRYFVLTLSLATIALFIARAVAFRLLESPKFLLARGRDQDAVDVVHQVALRNGAKTWLTVEILHAVTDDTEESDVTDDDTSSLPPSLDGDSIGRSGFVLSVLREHLSAFSINRLRPLFHTRTIALTTSLIWFAWATIGMGYPLFNAFLPQYLSHTDSVAEPNSPAAITANGPATGMSRNMYGIYVLASAAGVPGSFLAAYMVDQPSPFLGRRGTLAVSTLTSAIFLYLFVLFGKSREGQVIFSCANAFVQNIMYAVLYAMTPELFQSPTRGVGSGVASFFNRMAGLLAPIIAATLPGDGGAAAPVYLASALILAAFFAVCLLPVETRGIQTL